MELEDNQTRAEQFKELGNDYFKKKSYMQAIENYTKAIGIIIVI
jgi:hypothetical protein